PFWPAGPAWFLWVLLVLGALCAALTRITPRWGEALGRIAAKAERPATFFALLVAVALVAYLPPALALDAGRWVSWRSFTVQASRPLLYAVFYFAGVGLGAHGVERGLLAHGGPLARRWPWWVLAALVAFVLCVGCFVVAIGAGAAAGTGLWAAV